MFSRAVLFTPKLFTMPPKRLPCPLCGNKFYSDWFPKFGRPDAKCFMCLTNENVQYLESVIKSHQHAIEDLKQENTDLKAELKELKKIKERNMNKTSQVIPPSMTPIETPFQTVRNKRKTPKPTPKIPPRIHLANKFSLLEDEGDHSEPKQKQNINRSCKVGKPYRPINKYSTNEKCTYVISDSILRGQGHAFASNHKGKKRSVK